MSLKIAWSEIAREDRDAIFDFVSKDSPRAADRIDLQIENDLAMLTLTPALGRSGRVSGTRELTIKGTPYLAIYRVQQQTVRILRVLHGAQQWPPA